MWAETPNYTDVEQGKISLNEEPVIDNLLAKLESKDSNITTLKAKIDDLKAPYQAKIWKIKTSIKEIKLKLQETQEWNYDSKIVKQLLTELQTKQKNLGVKTKWVHENGRMIEKPVEEESPEAKQYLLLASEIETLENNPTKWYAEYLQTRLQEYKQQLQWFELGISKDPQITTAEKELKEKVKWPYDKLKSTISRLNKQDIPSSLKAEVDNLVENYIKSFIQGEIQSDQTLIADIKKLGEKEETELSEGANTITKIVDKKIQDKINPPKKTMGEKARDAFYSFLKGKTVVDQSERHKVIQQIK